MIHNRTAAASQLLSDMQHWCSSTGTPPNSVGHVLFLHPGFFGLLRKRLTVTEEKEEAVREFMASYPNGWRGLLPQMHANIAGRRAAGLSSADTGRRFTDDQPRVDRDPCPRCGVRHDIGCGHSRAPLGMMM